MTSYQPQRDPVSGCESENVRSSLTAGSGKCIEKDTSRRPYQEYLEELQEKMVYSKHVRRARVMLNKLTICFKCGDTFPDLTELTSHLETVHGLSREFSQKILKLIR